MTGIRPSGAVVEAVSRLEGTAPTELTETVADAIDPGALDALFADRVNPGEGVQTVRVAFVGHDVVVHADGRVEVDGKRVEDGP